MMAGRYESPWRKKASEVIAGVIADMGVGDKKALRKALREAYPFGERARHPYKIWLDEVKRQLGEKPPLYASKKKQQPMLGQRELF